MLIAIEFKTIDTLGNSCTSHKPRYIEGLEYHNVKSLMTENRLSSLIFISR